MIQPACALGFIEQHPEYESKIQDDPIELLEVIKNLMHDPIRAQYPLASMHEAVIRLINIKQYEGECWFTAL